MRQSLRDKAIGVCNAKIAQKGEGVGLSFYAFFKNKNDEPDVLMEAVSWWIEVHKLNHFEKAVKIRDMILAGL
jgi:hypothetical protein|tara:strand:+ start:2515 stop:2733 length:219 start_codon:yes stop_codon:yes gene_type:complete